MRRKVRTAFALGITPEVMDPPRRVRHRAGHDRTDPFLRPLAAAARLVLDAAVTGLNGVVYLAAAVPLEDLLGLPAVWLRIAGVGSSRSPFWRSSRRRRAPATSAPLRRRRRPGAGCLAFATG